MAHAKVRVQNDAIDAIVATAQQIPIESAQPVRHGGQVTSTLPQLQTAPRGHFFAARSAKKRSLLFEPVSSLAAVVTSIAITGGMSRLERGISFEMPQCPGRFRMLHQRALGVGTGTGSRQSSASSRLMPRALGVTVAEAALNDYVRPVCAPSLSKTGHAGRVPREPLRPDLRNIVTRERSAEISGSGLTVICSISAYAVLSLASRVCVQCRARARRR